jgi:hypothetical protein
VESASLLRESENENQIISLQQTSKREKKGRVFLLLSLSPLPLLLFPAPFHQQQGARDPEGFELDLSCSPASKSGGEKKRRREEEERKNTRARSVERAQSVALVPF